MFTEGQKTEKEEKGQIMYVKREYMDKLQSTNRYKHQQRLEKPGQGKGRNKLCLQSRLNIIDIIIDASKGKIDINKIETYTTKFVKCIFGCLKKKDENIV